MCTGWSGTGCVGAVATVAGAYVAWANWIGHRRAGNQNVVIALAQAAAAQPHIVAPQPPSGQLMLPGPTNPYEARVLSALEAMGYPGASAGPPKAIGENAWKIRVALPQGRNVSPEKVIAQSETLASNMQARRTEVEGLGSNLIDVTAFDGPDTLGRDYLYRWDGQTVESLDDAIAIAIDEAGRYLEILINDHLLISGKTGGGKSKLVRLILARTLGAPAETAARDGTSTVLAPPSSSTVASPSCACTTLPRRTLALPRKSATVRLTGWPETSRGAPLCTMRPAAITATVSDMASASDWSCVT